MKTLQRREPFFGEAADREILGPEFRSVAFDEMTDVPPELLASMGDGSGAEAYEVIEAPPAKPVHPDYCEKGTELPLGFLPHQGENRRTRRAAVATWAPPKQDYQPHNSSESRGTPAQRDEAEGLRVPPPPAMPTRRELLKQRQRQRRGKLDTELRRLQRRKAQTK